MNEQQINKEREEKKVVIYYHVAHYPPSWGGTEYWMVFRGDEELVNIVKTVAKQFGHWDVIMGLRGEDGRFVFCMKEKAFHEFENLWNEHVVKFEEVDNDTITDLAD